MPIEVKVEKEMGIKNKGEIEETGIDKFTQKCKAFATKYIKLMNGQFAQLGVWMDFDKPYITYEDSYIAASWKTLKQAHEKGLMHEGVYVLPYCYRCETTMANYELEYDDETDPSVYVKFKSREKENEYFIIWTTTPWTLVANMGIMVHPTFRYVRVKVDGEEWWVAKDRMDHLLGLLGKSGVVLEELSGKKLEGRHYEHPFQDLINKQAERRIVLSDEYVTVEDGSGLVHTSPGTGPEDFIIGKRFGIEPFCPIDEHGNYTAEAGERFAGKNVKATNPEIIELLEQRGILIRQERIRHRYPHCWRCKTPLIFMTTKQWFITISKFKEKMLSEIENVNWHPDFAKIRFREFVENAPDWCISRQRYWGIPLPIWKCDKCSKIRVVGSPDEISKVKELHRPYIDKVTLKCECKSEMHRVPDVLDVWFDSGNAVWASLSDKDIERYGDRTDMIIEGQDQFRGWFYSLLGSGVIRYDQIPYKRLLMHGFFVDEKGQKMSKSLGNFVPLEEILEKYGADSFRLWSLSNTIWEELRFNWEELRKSNGDLNILANLVTFLERFHTGKNISTEPGTFELEDEWIISECESMLAGFKSACESYEINKAIKLLRQFWVEELSRFYMKIAKERINKDENAEAALYTLYYVNRKMLIPLSMVSPFIAESLYQSFFRKFEKEESVFLLKFPNVDETKPNKVLGKQMEIAKQLVSEMLELRQEAKLKLRWPVRTLYVETKSHDVMEAVKLLAGIIRRLCNVKAIELVEKAPEGKDFAGKSLENANICVSTKLDEELYEEGMVNEIKRRVQMLRKQVGCVEKDVITIYLASDKEIDAIVERGKERILKDVNAGSIIKEELKEMQAYDIDGHEIKLAVVKKKK